MSSLRITPTPQSEIASECGSGTLSAIYRRAIQRYEEKQKDGSDTAPNGATKAKEDSADAVRK